MILPAGGREAPVVKTIGAGAKDPPSFPRSRE